ncbi:MAG: uncharacterized protein K0Q49_2240, partial [Haloplasmataceae bacterium]|nr:uncharacterized protein [Haloplasmataceae bacterium]
MASNRRKKEKKKDFVKQKLKVGKTALKNANHTSTEFKAKKINISSSTKNLINNSLNNNNNNNRSIEYVKKLSVVRKTTSNLNSRKEILSEFLELLKKDPFQELYQIPLDELIKVLKMLFLDQSKKIRTDSREILNELIKNHNNLIILNHDSLMLFIFSAMTHLKPTIRQDSIYTLRLILDGGERLKSLTISNYWIRVWKNLLILMNWKKENKSYVDSNDFKDFDGMRLEQLNFLNDFLNFGCLPDLATNINELNDENIIQQHDLLAMYMIKPNMGMLYRNLKLFGNVNLISNNSNNNNYNNNNNNNNNNNILNN